MIRNLVADDYDEVVSTWERAGLEFRPLGRDSRRAYESQLRQSGDMMLAEVREGRIAGVIIGSHDSRKAWINRLAVCPDHRRRGIARKLVDALEKVFHKQGIEVISALIYETNVNSRRLFEELGYSCWDSVKYYSKRPSPDA